MNSLIISNKFERIICSLLFGINQSSQYDVTVFCSYATLTLALLLCQIFINRFEVMRKIGLMVIVDFFCACVSFSFRLSEMIKNFLLYAWTLTFN